MSRDAQRIGINSGTGMLLGAGIGLVFTPHPFGMIVCAAIGLVIGAIVSGRAVNS